MENSRALYNGSLLQKSPRDLKTAREKWNTAFNALEAPDNLQSIMAGNAYGFWAPITNAGFGDVKVFPGMTATSAEPESEEVAIYADNKKWFATFNEGSVKLTIESVMMTEEFMLHALGKEKNANGSITDTANKGAFAFGFEELIKDQNGNEYPQLTIYYNCVASAPKTETKTIEAGIEAKTISMECSASRTPLALSASGSEASSLVLRRTEETASVYDTFMDAIITPTTEGTDIPAPTLNADAEVNYAIDEAKVYSDLITDANVTAMYNGSNVTSDITFKVAGATKLSTDTIDTTTAGSTDVTLELTKGGQTVADTVSVVVA